MRGPKPSTTAAHQQTGQLAPYACTNRPAPAAPALLSPPLPPDYHSSLYTYYSDTETITEGLTVAFLGHLQTTISANGANSSANADLQEVIQEFKSVARDVLSYLRYHNSQALLLLLRQYSQTRSFTMADVDPDVLHQVGSCFPVLSPQLSWLLTGPPHSVAACARAPCNMLASLFLLHQTGGATAAGCEGAWELVRQGQSQGH
jgi:hypothetical protein